MNRKGIALLITLFFIMAITVAIGVGLKQVNKAKVQVESEKLILQSNMLFDDVLTMLKNAKELDYLIDANLSGDAFGMFLDSYSIPGIPMGETGIVIAIDLQSARSKINVNTLTDSNISESLRYYFNSYMVNQNYVDMLIDTSSGVKLGGSYRTDIFYEKPFLYRDNISSSEHLQEVNEFYLRTYRDSNINKINFDNLFSYSKRNVDYKVDLNCATVETLEVFLADKNRALLLVPDNDLGCNAVVCASLSEDQLVYLENMNATCKVQPYINVEVDVMQNNQSAKISFEYDIEMKKGYNFVYEI